MNPSAAAFALILQQRQQLQQQGHGNLAGQGHANQSASGGAPRPTQPKRGGRGRPQQNHQQQQPQQPQSYQQPLYYQPYCPPPFPYHGLPPPLPSQMTSTHLAFMPGALYPSYSALVPAHPPTYAAPPPFQPLGHTTYGPPPHGQQGSWSAPSSSSRGLAQAPGPAGSSMPLPPPSYSSSLAASHFSHQLGAAGPRGSNPAPNPYVNTPTPTPAPPTPTTATPGMQSWFCEPCDKEFSAVTAFDAHVATHEACPHPGCPFSATKKAVSAHFHGAHGLYAGTGFKTIDVEGQRFRVLLGTSPEEVSQWRADRKRKFPTAESEQSKSQQLQELEEAGGVHLVDKRRRRDPEGRGGRDKGDKSRDRRREGEAVAGASAGAWKKPQSAPDPNQEGEIPTASSAMEGAEEAKGAEVMEGTKGAAEVEGAETAEDTGGMGDTGTGDRRRRCIHFARGRCTAAPGACSYSHDFTPRVCEFFVRGFCKRGNRCLCVHDRAARADGRADKAPDGVEGGDVGGGIGGSGTGAPGRDPDRPRTARGELYLPSPLEGGKRGTLWGNLLKDAAQREENVVLQCLRLLVKGDFLQKA